MIALLHSSLSDRVRPYFKNQTGSNYVLRKIVHQEGLPGVPAFPTQALPLAAVPFPICQEAVLLPSPAVPLPVCQEAVLLSCCPLALGAFSSLSGGRPAALSPMVPLPISVTQALPPAMVPLPISVWRPSCCPLTCRAPSRLCHSGSASCHGAFSHLCRKAILLPSHPHCPFPSAGRPSCCLLVRGALLAMSASIAWLLFNTDFFPLTCLSAPHSSVSMPFSR